VRLPPLRRNRGDEGRARDVPGQQSERLCRRYTSLSIYARIVLPSASVGGRDEIAACVEIA
jgi:hypothetical protein